MPRPNEQAPEMHVRGDRTIFEHPAFGSIGVFKTQGGRNVLFRSDLIHDNVISLRLYRATEERSLYHSRHYAEMQPLFEVQMSETQWASLVSSIGIGNGVPCTIRREPGNKDVPLITYQSEDAQFRGEMKGIAAEPLKRLYQTRAKIEESVKGLTKAKQAEILYDIDQAIKSLSDSLPFVAESYAEYMEKVREAAKAEINAHHEGVVRDLGLQALAARAEQAQALEGRTILSLPDLNEKGDEE